MALSFGGLILLLLLTAVFMHRWINRASEGERREKQEQLEVALRRSVSDFSAVLRGVPELTEVLPQQTNLERWISQQFQAWRGKTPQPAIVRAVSVGRLLPRAETAFSSLLLASETPQEFVKVDWPEALVTLRTDLIARAQKNALQPMTPGALAQLYAADRFFIVLPLTISVPTPPPVLPKPPSLSKLQLPRFGPMEGGRPPFGSPPFGRSRLGGGQPGPPEEVLRRRAEDRQRAETEFRKEVGKIEQTTRKDQMIATQRAKAARPIEQLAGFCFLELDNDWLQKQFLPNLIAQHFNQTELANYHVAVVVEPEQQLFFVTDTTTQFASFDAQEILFQGAAKSWRGDAPVFPQTLSLRVRHKAGSLQSVLARTRWRNLAFGYGVLLLLFASASALLIATQRARTLAQRQMEFVAGVTHELRTPLTAIQSAGFNLSSGRVNDAERVKQYGTMIHTEGRRLADLIDQVLSYARIESSGTSYNFQPLQVDYVIEQALGENQSALADWRIEKNIEADLPLINADANVLGSALRNLLQNALKYAEQGKWLRIEAVRVHNDVQITVADHGPGIDRRDLPHIFAPFYRAQKMVASAVPGTGLGLSLVSEYLKAHHGRVTVDSVVGKGTAFTLHLPVHTKSV